jgi:ATP-dependent DNA ligase
MRLHPAESRIRRLSAETPSRYIAFDILVWDGEAIHTRPLRERRGELEKRAHGFTLSPTSRDPAVARHWLERLEIIGLDGVIAKRLDLPYKPGSRDAVNKVKHHRTVDCVIVGYRTSGNKIASLLLGLYQDDGTLDFVGHTSGIPQALQEQLGVLLPPLKEETHAGEEWGRTPGGGSRWSQGKDLPWHEVRPEIVCEVRFDKMEEERFRHGTRFLRFRPDKDPRQCTWDQVKPTPKPGDPRLDVLLQQMPRGGTPG